MTVEREQAGIQTPPDNHRNLSLRQSQMAAIRAAGALSLELISDSEKRDEIVRAYRQSILPGEELLSLVAIGEMVVPEDFHIPNVKANAVRIVINASLDPEEREAIDATRRKLFAERRIENMGEDAVIARMQSARDAHIENIRNGTTIVDSRQIVEGLGHTRWTETEKTLLRLVADSAEFRYPDGVHKGKPDWDRITKFVNDAFHGGEAVRSRQALVHEYYGHTSGRKKKK